MRILSLVICLVASASFANLDLNSQLGVRSRAMGGAGRAISTTNEAIFLNPAGFSQFRRFNLDADYVHDVNDPEHLVGLTLVDSTAQPVAGAVDFHMIVDPSKGSKSLGYMGAFGASMPILGDYLYLGAVVKYSYLPIATLDPVQVNQFGIDTGLLAKLGYGLSFGVVGYNLVPTNSRRLPLSVGLGVAFSSDDSATSATDMGGALAGLNIAFDWIFRDLTSAAGMENQLMAGAEYLLASIVPLRVGYNYSLEKREHVLSCGTGFASGELGVDGFFEQNLTTTDDRSFGVAVRLLF